VLHDFSFKQLQMLFSLTEKSREVKWRWLS